MSFGELPDLGKIGKRIGKRLRDILNPPVDNGPSKEERLAQRLQDGLKGLVYFDNFDEIADWRVEDIDPVQQANTPLLKRSASQVYDQHGPTSRVLLCHDYSGGYQDWEGVRPSPIQAKPYSCKYFQFIEFFIYFSHKIVCIPPASWINSCHRNGVKILGNFIMEGDGKAKSIERMLDQLDGEYIVARQLANMARAYGFDGWLLNIEAEFPLAVQHPISDLTGFIRSLKRQLGRDGTVIWYDAITKDNEVDYQNALTWKNVEFALAADLFFTNYKWNITELHESMAVAEQHGIKPAEVYFGVDCWAQNSNMPGPPRVTYPPNGGGGTLTGLATHVLAQNGFSNAIFGPGWPYEHFSGSLPVSAAATAGPYMPRARYNFNDETLEPETFTTEAEAVEYSMWEGTRLPDRLSCDCKGDPHHRSGYRDTPIIRAARQYPAGSSTYFETNFQQAFCPALARDKASSGVLREANLQARDLILELNKDCSWDSKLGLQATLPNISNEQQNTLSPRLHATLMSDGSPRLHVSLIASPNSHPSSSKEKPQDNIKTARVCLFKLNLATDVGLTVRVHFKFYPMTAPYLVAGFYTKAFTRSSPDVEDTEYEIFSKKKPESHEAIFNLNNANPNSRIVEIGLYCQSQHAGSGPVDVLDLHELTIKPTVNAHNRYVITDLEIYHRASGSNSERRLRWAWGGLKSGWPDGLPWSDLTGPFSVFTILASGEELGQANCLEFPLRPHDLPKIGGSDKGLVVKGHLFGGGEVLSAPQAKFVG